MIFEIKSLGFGFSNEGAVLYNSAAGREPVYLVNAGAEITSALFERLQAALGDEDAYLGTLEEEGVVTRLSSPSVGESD